MSEGRGLGWRDRARARELRNFASEDEIGANLRMTPAQAAVGLADQDARPAQLRQLAPQEEEEPHRPLIVTTAVAMSVLRMLMRHSFPARSRAAGAP